MRFIEELKQLSKFELILWISSITIIVIGNFLSTDSNMLSTIASLIGVTALIFVAKGLILGQILSLIFSVFYGIVSLHFAYYGEMITYLGMTAPMALLSIFSWIKHPYKNTSQVEISKLNVQKVIVLSIITALVNIAFYFILKALNTPSLLVSTFSVSTSFLAVSLTFLRSPYYALAYAANDIVLIILWSIAITQDISYLPMLLCFITFLVNDTYAFINWKKMQNNQKEK